MPRKISISPPIDVAEVPKWRVLVCRFLNGLKDPEPWIDFTLQNGWVSFGGIHPPMRYHKDDMGYVYIEGAIKDGTYSDGTVLATLPENYRPDYELHIFAEDHNPPSKLFYISINPNGEISIHDASTNVHVEIFTMSFRVC